MTAEVWKPVPVKGYEHLYSVSNLGRVRAERKEVKCKGGGTRTNPPRILRWDTRRANIEDSRKNGTMLVGEAHPEGKLTEQAVREIRASKEPAVRLAPRYGVSDRMIGKVRKREAWAYVI